MGAERRGKRVWEIESKRETARKSHSWLIKPAEFFFLLFFKPTATLMRASWEGLDKEGLEQGGRAVEGQLPALCNYEWVPWITFNKPKKNTYVFAQVGGAWNENWMRITHWLTLTASSKCLLHSFTQSFTHSLQFSLHQFRHFQLWLIMQMFVASENVLHNAKWNAASLHTWIISLSISLFCSVSVCLCSAAAHR